MDDLEDLSVTVKIVDFDMPFWKMVIFFIKVALAAIPAIVIITVLINLIVLAGLSSLLGG